MPSKVERPNVVFVVFDTARADVFEPYGARTGSSPAMAQLAGRGSAAQGTNSTSCWTLPSHVSLFTGLLPRAAGLSRAPGGRPHGCAPVMRSLQDRLLPAFLADNGYRTQGISTNLWVTDVSGFDTGFEDFVAMPSPRQEAMVATSQTGRLRWLAEAVLARHDDGARAVEAQLARWLSEDDDRPFFWFVNLIECHSPYLPPKPYNDLGPIARVRAAREAARHLTLDAVWRSCCGGFDIPAGALARMRHLYERSILLLDSWLGRLLERLDDAGVLDDTIVMVTSDHGENLGEGDLIGHAFSLDDRLVRIPFVVGGPGAERVALATLAGVPRLVAELALFDDHPWQGSDYPDGISVAQFDAPASADDPRIEIALREWGLGREAASRLSTSLTSASDGRWKLVVRGEQEDVYDLETDPLETDPTGAVPPERLDALRAALRHPGAVARSEPAAPMPVTGPDQPPPEEMARIEEQMRQLGYL